MLHFIKHHLKSTELSITQIDNYFLVAKYCWMSESRSQHFIHKHLQFTTINLHIYCTEQDNAVCAVKLNSTHKHICILTIYRVPVGKFNNFLTQLEEILQTICNPKLDFIICGDININHLTESSKRGQFDAVLMSYKLISTATFPIRTENNSSPTIDNIFIDTSMFENYAVSPSINKLSDHDVQMIIIHIPQRQVDVHLTRYIRKIKNDTIAEF